MRNSGLNLSGIRENNRALLLRYLCTSRQITRSELAKASGLSSMTVTNIVGEFLSKNLIEEVSAENLAGQPGRTPMALQLSEKSPVIIGLFLSRSAVFGAVGDMSIHTLTQEKILLEENEDGHSILKKMVSLVSRLRRGLTRPVLGIGVATVGVVDTSTGIIRYITDFYNVKSLPIKACLEEQFPYPVFVSNDMQAAGLCELFFGCGKKEDSFLYVGITKGVGAAVISNRELLDCRSELGHMSINSDGPKCTCGNSGCLELYVSSPRLQENIEDACGIKSEDIRQTMAYAGQDPRGYSILYHAIQQLAAGIGNFLNLIDVPMVVLGHDAFYLPDELIKCLEQAVQKRSVSVKLMDRPLQIEKSAFGDMAPMYGSFCVVLQRLFRGEFYID